MHALFRGCVAATLVVLALPLAAQSYPAKPVRIIVPFPPAGAADLLTRALGKTLAESWGQAVVADNRPGAGGNIGAEAAAKAAPDGYTLFMAAVTTHAVSMGLYAKLGYDIEKDLAPVTLVANVPHILVAHPAVSLTELALDHGGWVRGALLPKYAIVEHGFETLAKSHRCLRNPGLEFEHEVEQRGRIDLFHRRIPKFCRHVVLQARNPLSRVLGGSFRFDHPLMVRAASARQGE